MNTIPQYEADDGPLTDAQLAQVQAAAAPLLPTGKLLAKKRTPKAADFLNGETPHQRAEVKRRKVIDWLYRWGYSSGPILMRVSGAKSAVVGKLEKAGLIVGTRTAAGGAVAGVPSHYYTLTESGLQFAEHHTAKLMRYPEIDRYRINQQQLRHYLLAQSVTLSALDRDMATDYLTEKQTNDGDESGLKRPDVLWRTEAGLAAVEIELSSKWDRRLDEFVRGIYNLLDPDLPTQSERVVRLFLVSDSRSIIDRYRKAMQPGAKCGIWKKDKQGKWSQIREEPVPAHMSRCMFMLVDEHGHEREASDMRGEEVLLDL